MNSGKNVPGPEAEGQPDNYTTATKENEILEGGDDLQQRREANQFRRDERARDALSFGRVLLFRLLPWGIVAVAATLGWHYLAPEQLAWLSENQIQRLESAIAGSTLSVALILLRKYI